MATNTLNGFKTTFYLSEENKKFLEELGKGEKTKAVNEAIAKFFVDRKREQEMKKFYKLIDNIKPVKSNEPLVDTIRKMREERTEQILQAVKS